MLKNTKKHLVTLLIGSAVWAVPAWAQDAQVQPNAEAPSESAMVNLVRALVKQKALKPEVGDALIKQAEAEASQARAAKAQAASTALPDAPAGAIRVAYIPDSVRTQIKDELRAEVFNEAKVGRWAAPEEAAPDWTRRITLHGDVRIRSQSELYSKTNSNLIFDYARINASGPIDIENPFVPLPTINSRVDRWNRLRIRARLGADIVVAKGVTAAFQIATGDDNSPISTNASLAGGLGKRDLWLDQAYLKVEPNNWFNAKFGRFPNPFASTDLLFDSDVNFDGVALEINPGKYFSDNLDIAVRGGAFPLDFGSADFPILSFDKVKVPAKYLFSGEIEAKSKFGNGIEFAASAGYHVYKNIQGELSAPCDLAAGVPECSTDRLRPFFLRKGNTLSPLRNIVNDPRLVNRPQFLGLTFGYNILDLNASVEVPVADDIGVKISGNYLKNLAFKRGDICRNGQAGQPVNNGGTNGNGRDFCGVANPVDFVGGSVGYMGRILLGTEKTKSIGQWNLFAGYRYLESDAVLDALTDSDFHLGGTNAKGYFVGGRYGLFDGVSLGGRWMSANQVSGEPFAIDVLQIDLQAAF